MSIDRDVYHPFRRAWGIPDPASTQVPPKLFEIGGSLVAADPRTGQTTPVYTAPKKTPEFQWEIAPSEDLLGKGNPKRARFTTADFVKQWDTLPDYAKKSLVNQSQLRASGYDPTTGKPLVSAPEVSSPSPFRQGSMSFTRGGVTETTSTSPYKSDADVRKAFESGKISKETALSLLKQQFGY
jgi:hypothetical protein